MRTKLIFRHYYGEQHTRMFQGMQTNIFYPIPSLMLNFCIAYNRIRFAWLFWEVEYEWGIDVPSNNCGKEIKS